MYIAVQGKNGIKIMNNTKSTIWATSMIVGGVVGMTVALTVAGYSDVIISRAQMGATWAGYFDAQATTWLVQGMVWRLLMGVITFIGFLFLAKDLLSIGKATHHVR